MAIADDYPARRRGALRRALIWFGHITLGWDRVLYPVIWAFIILSWWWKDQPTALEWAPVPVAALLVALALGEMAHRQWLCPRDEAPFLADPQAAVDDNIVHLRRFHHPAFRYWSYVTAGLPLLLLFTPVTRAPWPVKAIAMVGIVVLLAYNERLLRTSFTHNRLQIWCPICHPRGDGDTPVVAPVPDPAGTGTR